MSILLSVYSSNLSSISFSLSIVFHMFFFFLSSVEKMAESFVLLSTFICLFFSYPLTLPSLSISMDPKRFRVSLLSFFYVCSRIYVSHQFLRLWCLFIYLCLLFRMLRKVKLCLSRYLYLSVKRSVVIEWVTWYCTYMVF